jgi:hypothetical protein
VGPDCQPPYQPTSMLDWSGMMVAPDIAVTVYKGLRAPFRPVASLVPFRPAVVALQRSHHPTPEQPSPSSLPIGFFFIAASISITLSRDDHHHLTPSSYAQCHAIASSEEAELRHAGHRCQVMLLFRWQPHAGSPCRHLPQAKSLMPPHCSILGRACRRFYNTGHRYLSYLRRLAVVQPRAEPPSGSRAPTTTSLSSSLRHSRLLG